LEDFFIDEVLGKNDEAQIHRLQFKKEHTAQEESDDDDDDSMPLLEEKGHCECSSNSLVHYPAKHEGWDSLGEPDSDSDDDTCLPLLPPLKQKKEFENDSDIVIQKWNWKQGKKPGRKTKKQLPTQSPDQLISKIRLMKTAML
jgi:hypothetical protein